MTPTPTPPSWEPIETAPRDGTEVLVFHHGLITIAWWSSIFDEWQNACSADWCHEVTHWMPLPEAPPEPTP